MKYGRSEDEWDELVDAATEYLAEVARSRTIASYTDLNLELVRRTGRSRFDFNMDRDQAAVGALLGEVTEGTYDEIGAMLSSLVVQKATGDPGEGFYRLARSPGEDKFEFFQAQVGRVNRTGNPGGS
jgi:hypothetical protein